MLFSVCGSPQAPHVNCLAVCFVLLTCLRGQQGCVTGLCKNCKCTEMNATFLSKMNVSLLT